MTKAQLQRALEQARADLPRYSSCPTCVGCICPNCGNQVTQDYKGPAKHRLSWMIVGLATHYIVDKCGVN